MKKLTVLSFAILALTCLNTASAQQGFPADAKQQQIAEATKQAYSRHIEELKYDDLPLEEIVQNLRKEFPEVNFILPEELGQIIVRLEMRNVTLPEILQAIQIACRNDHLKFEQVNERLVAFSRDENAAQSSDKPILRAFNLGGYLATRPSTEQEDAMDMVHALVQDAIQLLAGAGQKVEMPAHMMMHQGTKMVLVVGTPEQLQIIDEIVSNLPGMNRTLARKNGGESQLDARFLQRYGIGSGGFGGGIGSGGGGGIGSASGGVGNGGGGIGSTTGAGTGPKKP